MSYRLQCNQVSRAGFPLSVSPAPLPTAIRPRLLQLAHNPVERRGNALRAADFIFLPCGVPEGDQPPALRLVRQEAPQRQPDLHVVGPLLAGPQHRLTSAYAGGADHHSYIMELTEDVTDLCRNSSSHDSCQMTGIAATWLLEGHV